MDWLLTRETVILLAIFGAIPSVAASVLQSGGRLSVRGARLLNLAGYFSMAASMVLFVTIGFSR